MARRLRRSANGKAAVNVTAVAMAGPSSSTEGVIASVSARLAAAVHATICATSRACPVPTRNPGVTASWPHSSQ